MELTAIKEPETTPGVIDMDKVSDLKQKSMQIQYGVIDSRMEALLSVKKLLQSHDGITPQFEFLDEDQ